MFENCLKLLAETENCGVVLYGRTMGAWAELAFGKDNPADKKIVVSEGEENLIAELKPHLDLSREYTVLIFSDAPLLTLSTLTEAVETAAEKGLNVLKMTRGYVFKTAYLFECEKIYAPKTYYFEEEDFLTARGYKQTALINDCLKRRILDYHAENGVYIIDFATTFIDGDAVVAKGVTVEPNNIIKGKSVINANARLKSGNYIDNSVIGCGATLISSNINESAVGDGSRIGPFAYLRPGSAVGKNCRVGDFVEIKNSVIGDGSKLSHLSYVGDCDMGRNCNVGCGVVFCNYDGVKKHRSTVGDGVFIGSNSNLIAPIKIESGAFIAAGSTLSEDVPEGALAIARERQVNKTGWKRPC